jgi:hypothetical protein
VFAIFVAMALHWIGEARLAALWRIALVFGGVVNSKLKWFASLKVIEAEGLRAESARLTGTKIRAKNM